jgi:hypothetical protein
MVAAFLMLVPPLSPPQVDANVPPHSTVHDSAPRRATQCNPLGKVRLPCPHRRRLPRIHKVDRSFPPLLRLFVAPDVILSIFLRLCSSIGYSNECLGLHFGNTHEANLGDGNGRTPQLYLARQAYFPVWGTCWESVAGGHHFRAWRQNGTHAASGAWFIGFVRTLAPTSLFLTYMHSPVHLPSTAALTISMIKEHRKRSIRRSITRSSRMDTISAGTGLLSAPWPVAAGRGVTSGGAPKSNGARGFLSPAAGVRGFSFTCFLGTSMLFLKKSLTSHGRIHQALIMASHKTAVSPSSPSSVSSPLLALPEDVKMNSPRPFMTTSHEGSVQIICKQSSQIFNCRHGLVAKLE